MRYLILLSLILTACAGQESSQPTSKELFSRWQSSNVTLDLTGAVFGTNEVRFEYAANAGCDCALDIFGDQSSGTARVYSCDHYGPTDYCHAGAVDYTYTNQNAALSVCDGSDCEVYR